MVGGGSGGGAVVVVAVFVVALSLSSPPPPSPSSPLMTPSHFTAPTLIPYTTPHPLPLPAHPSPITGGSPVPEVPSRMWLSDRAISRIPAPVGSAGQHLSPARLH